MARLLVVERRQQRRDPDRTLRVGQLSINVVARSVSESGSPLELALPVALEQRSPIVFEDLNWVMRVGHNVVFRAGVLGQPMTDEVESTF